MYAVGMSRPPCKRMAGLTWVPVILAAAWVALSGASSAVAQDDAAGSRRVVANTDEQKADSEARGTASREARASKRQRKRAGDAEPVAAVASVAEVASGAPVASGDGEAPGDAPDSPQSQKVCRKLSVTGTRFTRRECLTVEQWAELDTNRSAQARRLVRDVQSRSSTMPAAKPGEDTPQGRPSGLPNPAGF